MHKRMEPGKFDHILGAAGLSSSALPSCRHWVDPAPHCWASAADSGRKRSWITAPQICCLPRSSQIHRGGFWR